MRAFFYRDKDGVEVDLILVENGTIYPIEIKKTSTPGKNDAKNFKALRNIKGMEFAKGSVVCSCQALSAVAKDVYAVPVEFV